MQNLEEKVQSIIGNRRQQAGRQAQALGAKTEDAFWKLADVWRQNNQVALAGGHPKPSFSKGGIHVREKGSVDVLGRIFDIPFAADIKHSVGEPWDASGIMQKRNVHQFEFLRDFAHEGFAAILVCRYPEHLFGPTWHLIKIFAEDERAPKYGEQFHGRDRWLPISLEDLPALVSERQYYKPCPLCGEAWSNPVHGKCCKRCEEHYE